VSDRTLKWIFTFLIIAAIFSVLAVIIGIIGQIMTTDTVRTW